MADSLNYSRFFNPWVLHFQKMGLELKCPLCLNLLNRPILMPCNHIFCSSCIPRSTDAGLHCPVCKSPYADEDLRSASHMENIVNVYRSMDDAFRASLSHWSSQVVQPDVRKPSDGCPASDKTDRGDKLRKEPAETIRRGSNGQSSIASLSPNKRTHVSPHHSEIKAEKSRDCVVRSFNRKDASLTHEDTAASLRFCQFRGRQREEGQTQEMDLNQVAPTSPESLPSFGDAKDSDDDSSAQFSKHGTEKMREDVTRPEIDMGLPNHAKDYGRESKRKKLNYGHHDDAVQCLKFENISNSKSQVKDEGPVSSPQPPAASERLDASSSAVCAFCQSSRTSQYVGPMLHYANGVPVAADDTKHSNVIHAHRKCIEWAPQAYYEDENARNLESEVARGAKLKCSVCGLKGAALGCYAKSCRKTFHVPCAVNTPGCRWDGDNYLMFCPAHSSFKFPSEKSKSRKAIKACDPWADEGDSNQANRSWVTSADTCKRLVLCGSALSVGEKNLLNKFARITGATVSKIWIPNVTHVIAATDEIGACSRTLKVLMAILNGRWILNIDWIKACMEAMDLVDEEPYEVNRDIHGCCDGPKNGRLRVVDNAPKLFHGLKFCFSGDFVPSYKGYLEDLVKAAGGTLLEDKVSSVSQGSDALATPITLVVYSLDPPQTCNLSEFSVIDKRCREAENLAAEIGAKVIGHTWLLESIAACKLQSIDLL
ncbi:PREDICTED: BRCA1-associated RING domain protein 1 [Nelumbo nucifera]|uniref:BRCA1-associated RING domain protein 1 n=1 Tax=Nelumbo nucifera TaxID=4432 RepID=A0A1U8ADD6_NELNU|nr:PREDICTED: BRCA1-associated RING domain protein 1 [Nelumbo nucifera]